MVYSRTILNKFYCKTETIKSASRMPVCPVHVCVYIIDDQIAHHTMHLIDD